MLFGGCQPTFDGKEISGLKAQATMNGSTAASANEARDAAFMELAEEMEPIDEPHSVSRIVSDCIEGQGTLPSQDLPEAIRIKMGNGPFT